MALTGSRRSTSGRRLTLGRQAASRRNANKAHITRWGLRGGRHKSKRRP